VPTLEVKMSHNRKANRLSYLKFAITNSYRKKKQMAKEEAERKRRLGIKSKVSAQTFFGPTPFKKQPPVEEVKSPHSQSKVVESSSVSQESDNEKSKGEEELPKILKTPPRSNKIEDVKSGVPMTSLEGNLEKNKDEPSQVFKTPPRSNKLEQLKSGVPMTSPGGNSPETNLKPRLRKDEILAELERNDNPQSPPMIVFKLLRSEKLKQKRYVRTTNFICDKPATKLSSGNDLPESIMIQQKEELTRNDNPQSPPIKRFCQLRTEKILKAAKRQPGFDLGKTVTKDKVTRSKTKLNLFGMTSDSLFSDIVEEKSPKIISQKDSIDNTKESTAKEEDANLSFARLTHTNQNTTSSYKSPRKIIKLAKQNENTVTESKHDKAEVIPIGNKVSLESDNNNIVEKIEESDGEENSVINKSKSSNVSILKGLSCQQHQSVHSASTSQKYLLSDEQTDSLQQVNGESNSAKTFIECSEDKQDSKAREPIQCLTVKSDKSCLRCTVNLANLTELETGCSKQVDNPDGSELKKVVRENSQKFPKVSKNKVTEVRQEDVGHGKDETEKQTKEAGESKPEAGEQIAMASSSLNRLEQDQTTQLGSLHQLETSLTETGEAEITSPGSTQVNQYPNMPADMSVSSWSNG